MTTKEKVIEIKDDIVYRENQPIYFMAIQEAALRMADWKDQQFKEYLKKKKSDIYWDEPSLIDRNTKLDLINEIINELFKED